jgi:hypothetical protein
MSSRALILLAILAPPAWGITDTLSGTGDVSEWVWCPEGVCSVSLVGDTDEGSCELQSQDSGESPATEALIAASDELNYRDTTNLGAGHYVRFQCVDATLMSLTAEIWPLRIMRNNQWFYRGSKDYNDIHCPDGCTVP